MRWGYKTSKAEGLDRVRACAEPHAVLCFAGAEPNTRVIAYNYVLAVKAQSSGQLRAAQHIPPLPEPWPLGRARYQDGGCLSVARVLNCGAI